MATQTSMKTGQEQRPAARSIPGFGGQVFAPGTAEYDEKRVDAEGFQAEMEDLLGVFSGDEEVRMLWGSFGDTNIANENARRCYYDDDTWKDLQKLKKEIDGDDLFHAQFIVQLP